ncbi:hypothetical protein BC351_39040 [Paenibacillus ferrarius]|uniref:Phosphoenolpyruvate synthase n=1 Tax=Paenibacillus ferrarius TaxID=1469647 RepID=A0A1V4H9U9_9BACL|nr:PEP/pyruvate-binding domain-containing protein [Paenibacillus ferrarius]OPH47986.1 hypothetical protein BC351_39040 [Paenibacillus ferrarius]
MISENVKFVPGSDTLPSLLSFEQVGDENWARVGNKAYNLAKLQKAGLPVPEGFCIPIEVYKHYLQYDEILPCIADEIVKVKQNLGGKIAIRSSANIEDGDNLSMAGVFESCFVYNDYDIIDTIKRIFEQSRSVEVVDYLKIHNIEHHELELALIVQRLVESDYSGVIYTGVNDGQLLVQYFNGFDSNLLDDGTTKGSSILINTDGYITTSNGFDLRPLSAKLIQEIYHYSTFIKNHYDGINQDIEFSCKNDRVYILQTRPMSSQMGNIYIHETPAECLESTKQKLLNLVQAEKIELGTNTAIFSDANYSELLPSPKEMDIGLYTYIFTGLDGIPGATQKARNEMGYLNSDESIGIISYIGGRTYFSISRNAGLYHIGFPASKQAYFSTLVNEYLEAIETDPLKGSYPQMGLYLQDPTLEDLEKRFGDNAQSYFEVYQRFVLNMDRLAEQFISYFKGVEANQISQYIHRKGGIHLSKLSAEELVEYCVDIFEHLRTKTCINFVKSARLGFYYSQKVIKLLQSRFSMDREEADKHFSKLTQGLNDSAITNMNISLAEAGSDEEALAIARTSIGHFSTGEMLEIRHLRMKDVPNALETYVSGIRKSGQYKELFTKQKNERMLLQQQLLSMLDGDERDEVDQIFRHAQTYMALRETIKYLLSMEYSLINDGLEQLEKELGMNPGDIYHLFPRELVKLVQDPTTLIHLIKSRKQSFENYKKMEMPSVIRESDIPNLTLVEEITADFDEVTGSFLAQGPVVCGVILNLDEFETLEQAYQTMLGYLEERTPIILVATQMNLTHDPFIAISDGLVIEKAGIVAHGAQRARELGKGAIGGIRSAILKTGMTVRFDPDKRNLMKICNLDAMN